MTLTIPPNHVVLLETLRVAVPLWMAGLAALPEPHRANQARSWAALAVDAVASRGDALQFGGKKGEAADVFNHLARGVAAAAYTPGGVTFAGIHWCADHSECESAARAAARTPMEWNADADVESARQRLIEVLELPGVSR